MSSFDHETRASESPVKTAGNRRIGNDVPGHLLGEKA
jgi:hypothetical protein